ncbi:MAG: translation elongation factor Ts [Bacteroidetes bacterium]|nr:translation elongation factor Ts [Bacteroidota bacterium]
MAITAADVNKLRTSTGAGMMDCKKALEQTNGDFEAAIDFLRKKGQKVAANRADRDAKEGVVLAKTTADGKKGFIIKLTSETDFVAKNADFIKFASDILDLAVNTTPADVEGLKSQKLGGATLADALDEQVAKIGEKIDVTEYIMMEGDSVVAYNHAGNRIGVLVVLNQAATENTNNAGKDAAMQIAAMNPIGVDNADVPAETIEREIAIAKEQIRAEGKPEEMVEKISLGKLNKFYKENTLLNQDFVKDPSKSVKKMLNDASADLTITKFKRIALGE